MSFIRSENIEDIVKTIVSKNWPTVASRGLINTQSQNPSGLGSTSIGTENNSVNGPSLFVNGTSYFGGSRVVGY